MEPACGCRDECEHQRTDLDAEMGLATRSSSLSLFSNERKAELHWAIRGSGEAFRDWPRGAVLRSKPFAHPSAPEVSLDRRLLLGQVRGVVEVVRGEKGRHGEKDVGARIVVQGLGREDGVPEARLQLGERGEELCVRRAVPPQHTFHFDNTRQRWDQLPRHDHFLVKASFSFRKSAN